MGVMTRSEVLIRRVANQRLAGGGLSGQGLDRPADVVCLLTCVQSQECAHGFWSLGIRTVGSSYADVLAEFNAGRFLRTHILRPTWHFVAPEDLRWIQSVTAPRVHQLNGTVRRSRGLDLHRLDRSTAIILAELAGGHHLTRPELGKLLGASGVELAYLVMHAELEALICNGPMRGAQHTYALVDEWVTASATGDAGELARRFFSGHGPASVADFARWSSLTTRQCTAALDQVADRLERVEVDGATFWFDPSGPEPVTASEAVLLPLYDEATLSYPALGFPRADDHPHPLGTDLFVGCVIVDRTNVGTWRRTVTPRLLVVELALAPRLSPGQREAARKAADRLAGFLGRDLELVELPGVDRV